MKKPIKLILGLLTFVVLIGINLLVVYPWFGGSGPADIGSIEVSYVSMARFIKDYSPQLSWAPYWYFGFPFSIFYTPLLPFFEYVLHETAGLPWWQAYRALSGMGLILAPASLFLLAWHITKKPLCGIISSLCYSFLPTLFYFILPSGEVARDMISQGFFDPRRITLVARWGEGPHILALVFLPLAGLFYDRLLAYRKVRDLVLVVFFTGLTALTNAVGLTGLVLLLLAVFLGRLCSPQAKTVQLLKISIVAGAASYGLIAFWYNLGFIGSFFQEGGGIARNYVSLFPWGYFLFFWIALGLYFFFNKIVRKSSIAVSLLWFLFCFSVVYVYYISAPSSLSEQRIEFAPQALRLMTEADMALALLIGVLTATLTDWLGKKKLAGKIAGFSLGLMIIVGLLMYGYRYLPYGQKALSQEIDLTQTSEYEVAQWLEQHTDKSKGERVYTAGNTGFYLNYFTDIWQLRGGLYQAKTHPWPEHIYYQMTNGKDSQIAEAWLKIANIRYLVVNTSASRELYKEFKHPDKFIGLKKVYENRGDIIYELPLADFGPAKVVKLDFVSGYQPPIKADDKKPLLIYADWLAKAKPADFRVINNDTYIIKANQETGEGILVQMTYDSGFRAKSDRGKVSIRSDPMGFLILVSSVSGEQTITLSHRPKISAYFGYLLTLVTIGGLIVWLVFYRKQPVG